eukprot:TRINITY_DN34270_c0_g1_i5.p1 TRINITY_DN34270_c0_g1~~TRINITY_DN34270_c0_g1_i5.p1  ORF type:complete len:309 (-),score=83.33 TRINITY_DN34270_c0_g1_i5:628-1554(-)
MGRCAVPAEIEERLAASKDLPLELQAAAAYEAYYVQQAHVQELVRSRAEKTLLVQANAKLKELKKKHAQLQKECVNAPPKTAGRGWSQYPLPTELPADDEDPRFVKSFEVEDAEGARAFLDEYGFVVLRDVISQEACAATREEIWQYLERRLSGFRRDEPCTWEVMSSCATGGYYDSYGLPPEQSMFTPQLFRNRQDQQMVKAWQTVLGDDDIVVSHDRWCFYRPTRDAETGEPAGAKATRQNLHLDLHPWGYRNGSTGIETLRYDVTGDDGTNPRSIRDFPSEINRNLFSRLCIVLLLLQASQAVFT